MQLRPNLKAQGNCMKNPFYCVPCMPVKCIDQQKVNSDFTADLQQMYFKKMKSGKLYSLDNVYSDDFNNLDPNMRQAVGEMHRARVVLRIEAKEIKI